MEFQITARQGLIVYFRNEKDVNKLAKFGNVIYVSKKMRYLTIYSNQRGIKELRRKLMNLKFVRRVLYSNLPLLDTSITSLSADLMVAGKKTDEKVK